MKFIKKIIKLLAILFLLILSLPLLLYVPFFYDKNFYKDLITNNVEKYSDYRLSLEKLDLSVYPDLKLNLKEVDLKTKEKEIPLLKLGEVNLSVFFIPVIAGGKLQVDDISLRNGFVDIPAFLNSIPDSKPDTEKESKDDASSIDIINLLHTRLRVKQILLQDIEIKIKPFHKTIYHDPIIKEVKLSYESFLESYINVNLNYGKTNIILTGNVGTSPEKLDLESLFFDAELIVSNLPLYEYASYLRDFPNLSVNGSNLNLKIKTKKDKDQMLIENFLDLILNAIYYKNKENSGKRIGQILLQGNINYPLLSKKIGTKNLQLTLPGLLHLKIDSDLDFTYHPSIHANINSSFVHISPILDLVNSLSNSDKKNSNPDRKEETPAQEKKSSVFVDIKYSANHITYDSINLYNFYANAQLKNDALNYTAGLRKLANGYLQLSGEANLQNGISTSAYLEMENVDLEKITKQILKKKFAEGTLSTYVKLQTDNKYGEKDFLKNLTLSGYSQMKDGVLLEQADILYPIRFLNKIIPSDDKLNTNISRFNSIDIDFNLKNQRFKVKNLDMQGKIFNTNGTADIGLENPAEDIRANLIVSTRIAGAGLKIPLVYSKSNYVPLSIDKVWLASVYAGMAVGGPVGAMIGSVLSETAGDAFKTIRNKTQEQFDENKKRLLLE
jgi:hypothetical protein